MVSLVCYRVVLLHEQLVCVPTPSCMLSSDVIMVLSGAFYLYIICLYSDPPPSHDGMHIHRCTGHASARTTHMHICMHICITQVWPDHCDQPVGPRDSMIRHQHGTLTVLVTVNTSLPYFSSYVLIFSWLVLEPLDGIAVLNVIYICFVYQAFPASHYSSKQLVILFSFLWGVAFYQSNILAAVFEWTGPHTPKHLVTSVQFPINAQTIKGREMSGRAEPELFGT